MAFAKQMTDEGGLLTWISLSVLSSAPSSAPVGHLPPQGWKVETVEKAKEAFSISWVLGAVPDRPTKNGPALFSQGGAVGLFGYAAGVSLGAAVSVGAVVSAGALSAWLAAEMSLRRVVRPS